MPINRGSTHGLYAVKEVTYGVTPSTPTLLQMPFDTFDMQTAHTVLRSNQIRSTPYLDRVLAGMSTQALTLTAEMQAATHDMLLETVFGSVFASGSMKHVDVLKSLTLESRTQVSAGLFNQFSGSYLNRLDVSASASDTAPVAMTFAGMAKAGALDQSATLATANTAAGQPDPYIFADATLKIATVAQPIMSGSFTIDRTVDPLMLWGSRLPREYIPGAVTATGSVTVPYDDATISAMWTAFADAQLDFTFADAAASSSLKFTFPRTRFTTLGRKIDTRGGLFQVLNFEAMYDLSSATVCTITKV